MQFLKLSVPHANQLLGILGELPAKMVLDGVNILKSLPIFEEADPQPPKDDGIDQSLTPPVDVPAPELPIDEPADEQKSE